MTRNPSMTEDDWRWFELSKSARLLSVDQVRELEEQLQADEWFVDARVQLVSYYSEYNNKNKLKHPNAERELFKHALWFIRNKPSLTGSFAMTLSHLGHALKGRRFAQLREAWLEQVSLNPDDGSIIGHAASFIVWKDIETAFELYIRAYNLQPTAAWLGFYVVHCHADLQNAPSIYKDEIRERLINVGLKSLETELEGAPFLTCEFVSDAALSLGRYDVVRWCAEILRDWNSTTCAQMADVYLGLVALRENDHSLAVELMLKKKRGYIPQRIVFRLASELFDLGEREAIIQLIQNYKSKIKKSVRESWIKQIESDHLPDFDDFCC